MPERHEGSALSLSHGSFSAFCTSNFADTYSALIVLLNQGATEPLGETRFNVCEVCCGI
jgi:hypothetical protein